MINLNDTLELLSWSSVEISMLKSFIDDELKFVLKTDSKIEEKNLIEFNSSSVTLSNQFKTIKSDLI